MDFGCGELTNFYTLIDNIKTKNKLFFCVRFILFKDFDRKKFFEEKKQKNSIKIIF